MTAVENTVKFRALATKLVAKFGTPMDWKVKSAGSYDPATGKVTGTTTTTHSNVLTTPPLPLDARFFSEDVLKLADTMAIVDDPSITFTPDTGDVVVFEGLEWAVLRVESFYPGATAAAHVCAIRRG